MIDSVTHERVMVYDADTAWSHIIVPVDQLAVIERMLRENHISYSVDADAISINGDPEVVFVNFARGVDSGHVQAILDAAL